MMNPNSQMRMNMNPMGGMSGVGGSAPPPNPLHMTFKNAEWPANCISAENVLEYFCNPANCFYDVLSCNQQIKMQNINRPLDDILLSLTGVQYVLWNAQHPLYVICKHWRNSSVNVTPLAYYYIINGVVYQSPDLYTFVQSRLLGAIEPLKNAFDQVMSFSRYNVAKGYYWEFKGNPAPSTSEEKKEKDENKPQARSSNFQNSRTYMLMDNLFQEFPPSSALEIENDEEGKAEAHASDAAAPTVPTTEGDGAATTTTTTSGTLAAAAIEPPQKKTK